MRSTDPLDAVRLAARDPWALPESWFEDLAEGPDPRDDLARVEEVTTQMTTLAAERFDALERMRVATAERALQDRLGVEIAQRGLRLEIAAALRVSESVAGRMISQAAMLARHPEAATALRAGRIRERHVAVLAEALDPLPGDDAERVVPEAVRLGEREQFGTFRRKLRRLVESVQTPTSRHEAALERRRIAVEPADDGMAWLMALLPAVEVQALSARISAMARPIRDAEGETRTLDQIRADVFGDLLMDGDVRSLPAASRGIRPTVAVTVPVLALLTADQNHGADAGTGPVSRGAVGHAVDPPTVEGVGPIPVDVARELCGAAEGWMRVLTHPESGEVLSVGRDRYRPTAALRRLVRWRAERCMAPGCGMSADRCEIDHTVAWEDGGATALSNLSPLCKGHHTVKHHGGWSVRQVPSSGGVLEWTSPAGRVYLVEPERRVPVFRPEPAQPPPTPEPAPF